MFADSKLEVIFWVAVVVAGFTCASLLVLGSVMEWIRSPSGSQRLWCYFQINFREIFSEMVIQSFATDANELAYPAITVCRQGYDPGL